METINSKRERFEKVASNRVQRILDTLALLQNCANRNNYDYSQEDVDQMFSEINKALKDTKTAFVNEMNKATKQGFKFNK